MSINQYWPIYKRLEKNVDDLTHAVHISDDQLDVYSSQNSDLILRIGAEIEAISKAIYLRDFDPQMSDQAKFDEVAIKKFVQDWKLDQKVAYLSHPNCFCSEREYKPFVKDTTRTGRQNMTFRWNNAYQNLKHNRQQAFNHASIGALLSAMAALYILNLYYRNEVVELGDDHAAARIDPGLGSGLFSVQFSAGALWDAQHVRQPKEDFSSSVYFIDQEKKFAQELKESRENFAIAYEEEIMNSPETQAALKAATPDQLADPKWPSGYVSKDTFRRAARLAERKAPRLTKTPKYQAIVNRHQVLDERNKG